jgi:hypothetical protein
MNWGFRGRLRVRETPLVSLLGDLPFLQQTVSEGCCYFPRWSTELPCYGYWTHGLLAEGLEDLCVEVVAAPGASAPPYGE